MSDSTTQPNADEDVERVRDTLCQPPIRVGNDTCPHCGAPVCPHCGKYLEPEDNPAPYFSTWVPYFIPWVQSMPYHTTWLESWGTGVCQTQEEDHDADD